MSIYLTLITLGAISLLAAMSPGPDFVVVTKNSLSVSRRAGILTALGVGLGIFVHVAYSIVGIGVIIAQSMLLFTIIKVLGALYIMYLGYQLLRAKESAVNIERHERTVDDRGAWAFVKEGFLTNALNPKATVFFLSVFTQIVSPGTPYMLQGLYGVEIALIVGIWFVALSYFLTIKPVMNWYSKTKTTFEKVMGGILVVLGIKVVLSGSR